jgi:formate-dependent nitrite reductase membrane component NrfD
VLLGSLITLAVVLEAEILTPHATLDAERAARFLTRGPLAAPLWAGVAGAGIALPIALLCTPWHAAWGAAAVLALAGLWLYEDLWIRAGQSVPLS